MEEEPKRPPKSNTTMTVNNAWVTIAANTKQIAATPATAAASAGVGQVLLPRKAPTGAIVQKLTGLPEVLGQ